jgi:polynucleotide 5'-triphosphatase
MASKSRIDIKYEHLREKDSFYEIPNGFLQSLPEEVQEIMGRYPRHQPRLRVTTDINTGALLAKIIKFKMADLQISFPRNNFDVRISIALEVQFPFSVEGLIEHREHQSKSMSRLKDRLSYKHQNISVDLTQVTSEGDGSKLHELELEIDSPMLIEQATLAQDGKDNDYEELVGIFLNYVRVLNRACGSIDALVQ